MSRLTAARGIMTAACRSCSGGHAAHSNDRPEAVETADIMPTLAAMIGLPVDTSKIDGHCLAGNGLAACPAR